MMRLKLLPILLFLLIILNGILIFMLLKKPHERKRNSQERNFLIQELQFTDHQKDNFFSFDTAHKENMMRLDQEIRKQKDRIFNSFSNKNLNLDSLTAKTGRLEGKKDAELFRFFSKVRNICTEEQQINFDKIINKALKGGKERASRKKGENHPPYIENGMPPPR
jgi:protein CpxP